MYQHPISQIVDIVDNGNDIQLTYVFEIFKQA